MAKRRMNVVYGEKYGDVNDPKTRWTRVGTLFIDDEKDGRMSIKIDCMPVGKHFDGWLSVFPQRDKDDDQGGEDLEASASQSPKVSDEDLDKPIDLSEIPF